MRRIQKRAVIAVAILAVTAGAIATGLSTKAQRHHPDRVAAATTARRRTLSRPDELAVAADYLGLPSRRLRGELRRGRTLAQIADATTWRSSAGLLDALLQTRAERLRARIAVHGPSAASAARRLARLRARVTAQLDGIPGRPAGEAGRTSSR
jgi:hypothetical protein